MYLAVKYVHVISVVLSLTGFFLRGILMMRDSPLLAARWIRVAPHVNDTVLLVAALSLAAMSGQYPFVQGWLTAKVLGLLAYIGLGMLALKPGRPPGVRLVAFLAALVTFAYIVSVALSKNPIGLLAGI